MENREHKTMRCPFPWWKISEKDIEAFNSFYRNSNCLRNKTESDLYLDAVKCEKLYTYLQHNLPEAAKDDLILYMTCAYTLGRYGRKLNI